MSAERTPVIIAAYNEAEYIGRTLDRLDMETVEPIVVVNGSTDETADIASGFEGVHVEVVEEQGKLPAQQHGLRLLGDRALAPLIFLDADTRPVFPKSWAHAMTTSITEHRGVTAGMRLFADGSKSMRLYRNTRHLSANIPKRIRSSHASTSGQAMGVNIQDDEILQSILNLEHVWPGEDWLVAKMISEGEGTVNYTFDPRRAVMTSARFTPNFKEQLSKDKEERHQIWLDSYLNRAAPGATMIFKDDEVMPLSIAESETSQA